MIRTFRCVFSVLTNTLGAHHSSLPTPSEFGSVDSESSQSAESLQSSYQRVQNALDTLKMQHAALMKLQPVLTHVETASSTHGSPLLPITNEATEEEEQGFPDRFTDSPTLTKRMSIATSGTDSISEWFDASEGMNEGAQEFVLDVQTFEGSEQPSRMLTISSDSRSSLDHADNSSIDTDIAEEEPPARMPSEDSEPDPVASSLQVVRRTKLPAPPVGDEGSLFSILKKNVGKVSVILSN